MNEILKVSQNFVDKVLNEADNNTTVTEKLLLATKDLESRLKQLESKQVLDQKETEIQNEQINNVSGNGHVIVENMWMPNRKVMYEWLNSLLSKASDWEKAQAKETVIQVEIGMDKNEKKIHPIIKKLREFIINEPIVQQLMSGMIREVNEEHPKHPIKTIWQLVLILNKVLTQAPVFINENKIISIPIATVFGDYAATKSGRELMTRYEMTNVFGEYLNAYKEYLDSKESTRVLYEEPNGWLKNIQAIELMQMEDFIEPKGGFTSFNEYFYRDIKPNARPITLPKDDLIITSPVDGIIYHYAFNIKRFDKFWIKEQPYSLEALLNNNTEMVEAFEGGTVWQAFLNPYNYHRWHTPVAGEIIAVEQVGGLNNKNNKSGQGLYYSILKYKGFGDFYKWTGSLPYMAMVNRRAIIYIKNPIVGLVAVSPVGMLEVSSINIKKEILDAMEKKEPYKVKKGDELGWFAYGGSTFTLLFQKNKIRNFAVVKNPRQQIDNNKGEIPILMGQKIAIAEKLQY